MATSIVAKSVKHIIDNRGLKQKAVAKMCGYNYSVFNNMLNGRKIISDKDISIISNVLQVEPNDLFGIKKTRSA